MGRGYVWEQLLRQQLILDMKWLKGMDRAQSYDL